MGYTKLVKRGGLLVPVGVAPEKVAAPPQTRAETVVRTEPPIEGGPSPALAEFLDKCFEDNAHKMKLLVRRMDDIVELRKAHDKERGHPDYPDGRSSVLNAIEERLGELGVEEPRLPTENLSAEDL